MARASTPPGEKRGEATRLREGVVIGDTRDKTRTVLCQYRWQHPKYGKIVMRDSKYHVHDPRNEAAVGDRVRIAPCRPISKTKSWRMVEIVEKAPAGTN